jgi:hypothetical protein
MYHNMFQTCLSIYVQRCVRKEPVQINWSRNPVRWVCRDCTDLNASLRSPVDRVKRIVVSKQRRHHLHIQLDAHTDCTHLTDRGYTETMVVTKQGKSFEDSLQVGISSTALPRRPGRHLKFSKSIQKATWKHVRCNYDTKGGEGHDCCPTATNSTTADRPYVVERLKCRYSRGTEPYCNTVRDTSHRRTETKSRRD